MTTKEVVNQSAVRVIEKTESLLNDRGWCKRSAVGPNGEYCLTQAVVVAASDFGPEGDYSPVIAELNKIVKERGWRGPLWRWNDGKKTTYEDVKAVLQEAKRRLRDRN